MEKNLDLSKKTIENINSGNNDVKSSKTKNQAWWQPAISVFFQTSSWIIFPSIASLFVGEWLKNRYNVGSWIILVCIGIAFFITICGLIKTYKKELKKMDRNDKK